MAQQLAEVHADVAGLRVVWNQMQAVTIRSPRYAYYFEPFFHPFVGELIGKLNQTSIADMLAPEFLGSPTMTRDYSIYYSVDPKASVAFPSVPAPNTALSSGGPYS